jgi:hypothetical protein
MHARKLHLHSMMVHAVLAAVPLAAAAFVLEAADVTLGSFGPDVWRFLVRAALLVTLLVALPSTLSGVFERGHVYVTWHRTHKLKLALSLVLVALVAAELAALLGGAAAGRLAAIAIVGGNTVVAALLSFYGLRMTLGRQSLARTSYGPDLLREPPVDVLAINADTVAEPPDLIDILQEMTT